jgi:hypothetical protein
MARAVLAKAEERTGATRWVRPTPLSPIIPIIPINPGSPDEVPPTVSDPVPVEPAAAELVLPVAAGLTRLLPSGGLDRGSTVVLDGSTALVLALLAEASRSGSWVGIVGLPRVGVLAAHQLGLDLQKVVLVPTPGPDGPTVVAALLDGVDVVVVGDVGLADADRRRLSARARERGAVLLSTTPWTGARVVLTVTESCWDGIGQGHGRLRERRLIVRGGGRGSAARGWRAEVSLTVGRAGAVDRVDSVDRVDRVGRAHSADPLADVARPLRPWEDRRAG